MLNEYFTSKYFQSIYMKITRKKIQGNYVNFTRKYFRDIYVSFTRNSSDILTWTVYVVFTTNCFFRFFDEMISSLFYDELARKYALRRKYNDEIRFLANFLVNPLLRRTHEENRRRKTYVLL